MQNTTENTSKALNKNSVATLNGIPKEILIQRIIKEFNERGIKEILRCTFCNNVPMMPPIFSCPYSHNFCGSCRDKVESQCNQCKYPVNRRNLPLEQFILSRLSTKPKDEMNKNGLREEKQGSFASRRQAMMDRLDGVVAEDIKNQIATCGRSVQCPVPCHTKVTAQGLYRHLELQHPEVFVTMLCKNSPSSISIPKDYINSLDECYIRCVSMLIVDMGDSQRSQDEKLLALNKLGAADLLSITHSLRGMLNHQTFVCLLSVSHPNFLTYSAWVTALYNFSLVKYTLSYSSDKGTVGFHGRPKDMYDTVNPEKDCLIIPNFMITDPSEDLQVTITFHMDIPFPPPDNSTDYVAGQTI